MEGVPGKPAGPELAAIQINFLAGWCPREDSRWRGKLVGAILVRKQRSTPHAAAIHLQPVCMFLVSDS